MSRYPVRLTAALLAGLALVALPAAPNPEAQGSKGTIKIATQSPLSGGQAALGEGIKLGAQLAIEKFRGNLVKMGYKVELVPFDDQAKPDVGVANAKNINADAEKKGIKVLGFEGTEEKSNFDPIVTPIKAKNPDVIYFGGIYDQAAPFFKQTREKGVKSKFLGPDGMDSSDLTKIAGKAVVGMYYTSAAGPASALPKAKAFVEDFKKKFGKNPEPYAAEAHDATAIAPKAIEAAAKSGKLSREDVATAVRKVKHSGITGEIEFDTKGDRKKALYFVLQVASDDPAKWGDNKIVKQLTIAPPEKK